MASLRIIPVLDIQDGVVVRGVGGRRHEYRPIVSSLTTSCDPVAVARVFREQFGFTECYVADLDAIAGAPPAVNIHAGIRALGFRLWVDAGIRQTETALPLLGGGSEH